MPGRSQEIRRQGLCGVDLTLNNLKLGGLPTQEKAVSTECAAIFAHLLCLSFEAMLPAHSKKKKRKEKRRAALLPRGQARAARGFVEGDAALLRNSFHYHVDLILFAVCSQFSGMNS